MAKREFLMKAHKYTQGKTSVGGWLASEKLDGMRCFWDGGISRGMNKVDVPWANTAKDARYVTPPVATGLWTMYGHPIIAPDWWLDLLPPIPLDGELWSGLLRQEIFSIVKGLVPSPRWKEVGYHCWDMPPYETVFADGLIDNINFKKKINKAACMALVKGVASRPAQLTSFEIIQMKMESFLNGNQVAHRHPYTVLPFNEAKAHATLEALLADVLARGGEGLCIRNPASYWVAQRSHQLLKWKPFDDAEAKIVGFTSGRETTLGSKLLGMIGALIVEMDNGIRFELSGMTNDERRFLTAEAATWATEHPESEMPDWADGLILKRGEKVNFKYRGTTADGIPCEARFNRVRNEDG